MSIRLGKTKVSEYITVSSKPVPPDVKQKNISKESQKVVISKTEPTNLKTGDIWLKPINQG